MRFRTIESDFEYNIKEIIAKFIKSTGTEAKGDELLDELWKNRELLGEIFFEQADEYCGLDSLIESE